MFCDLMRPQVTQGSLRTEGYHLGHPEGDRTVHLRLGLLSAQGTEVGRVTSGLEAGAVVRGWKAAHHQGHRVVGQVAVCYLRRTACLQLVALGQRSEEDRVAGWPLGLLLASMTREGEALGRLGRTKGDRVHGFRSLRPGGGPFPSVDS